MPRYNIPGPLAAERNFTQDRAALQNTRSATALRNAQTKGLMYELDSALPPTEARQMKRDQFGLEQTKVENQGKSADAAWNNSLTAAAKQDFEGFKYFTKEATGLATRQLEAYEAAGGGEAGVAAADALEPEFVQRMTGVTPDLVKLFEDKFNQPFDPVVAKRSIQSAYQSGLIERPGVQNFQTPGGIKSAVVGSAEYNDFVGKGFPTQSYPSQRQEIVNYQPGDLRTKSEVSKSLASIKSSVDYSRRMVSIANRVRNLSYDTPEALGKSGDFIQLVDNAFRSVQNIANVYGSDDFSAENVKNKMDDWMGRDLEKYGLGKTVVGTARFKGSIMNLAFAMAGAREGGKLTDRDINAALTTLGSTITRPEAFRATLTDAMSDVVTGTRIGIESEIVLNEGSGDQARQLFQLLQDDFDKFNASGTQPAVTADGERDWSKVTGADLPNMSGEELDQWMAWKQSQKP